jgi:hypothetical protein
MSIDNFTLAVRSARANRSAAAAPARSAAAWSAGIVGGLAALMGAAVAQERTNAFHDPFEQVTAAIPACPPPEGPMVTAMEARAESHGRVERGTSCYQSGRCRLPNAYLYDREIIPRVTKFIRQDPRFKATSLWIYGQRRWVFVMGCVGSEAQGLALERAIRDVDDVEAVIGQWMVGTDGKPPYRRASDGQGEVRR